MAESVSDQNVEDMLSSVRRLVSSELPRNQRPELKESASALVLTQAQRVEPKPPMQASRGLTLEERIAELEAAVGSQSSDWEPDGSEDQDVHRPDRIVYRPSRPRDEDEARRPLRLSEIALIETGPANGEEEEATTGVDEPEAEAVAFQHEPAVEDDASDVIAEEAPSTEAPAAQPTPPGELAGDPFADAVARDVAAVVAEMAETSLITEKDFEAALAEAVRDPLETRGMQRPPVNPAVDDVEVTEPEDETAESSLAAETETTAGEGLSRAEDEATPVTETLPEDVFVEVQSLSDGSSEAQGDLSQPAEPTLNAPSEAVEETEPDAIAEAEVTAEATEVSDVVPADVAADGDQMVDVTAAELKTMIAKMIREELQGELGERITRNVRKLVRQEVHRALSVRDLE